VIIEEEKDIFHEKTDSLQTLANLAPIDSTHNSHCSS